MNKDAVKTDIREGDRSTIVLEVEITAQELQKAIDEGVRHLARRTRVPGFRPGKAPRQILERALGIDRSDPESPNPIYDEAREHLYERTVLQALQEADRDVLELPREPEWTSFAEGEGAAYRVTLSVRPEVKLGDYTGFPFTPQVDEVTDEQVEAVIDQLRDQQAVLVPVEDRPAQVDDYAVISFEGRRDGEPVDGAQAERFPLIIGKERMVPGFEANLIGMREDEERTFTVTFPEDYGEAELAGQEVEFTAQLRELRERRLPDADDDFAGLVGPYEDLAALRAELRSRMSVNALDRARHLFADRVIEYATANATRGPAGRARGPRGRDDDRRAQGAHRPAGHPLRGLPARHGEDRGGPARGVPRARRAPRQGAARAGQHRRQGGGRASPTRRSRPRSPTCAPTRRATGRWPTTSTPIAAAATSARSCAARRSSSCSWTAGSRRTPSSPTCSTSTSRTRHDEDEAPSLIDEVIGDGGDEEDEELAAIEAAAAEEARA